MELGVRNGKVVWIRKDGNVSPREVPEKKVVSFYGFPEPYGAHGGECVSMNTLMGKPLTDEVILVEARGRGWWGKCLLSRVTGESVIMRSGEESVAEELVNNPTRIEGSLEDCVERYRQRKRDTVDLETMAKQRSLKVWKSRFFDGYWNPEHGEFNHLPQDWSLLPRGDSAVTRNVRKGPHWILMRKAKRYSIELGTLAPAENIESSFEELGGEETAARRLKAKKLGQEKREQLLTDKLRSAILRCFPRIPETDLEEVLNISRRGGAVGSAQWLYFSPSGETEEAFDLAANLAVRAYVRHNYTDYDEILFERPPGEGGRGEARHAVYDDVRGILNEWRKELT